MIELISGSATSVGLVRSVNEDSLRDTPPVFLVADGMGGYAAGDVASAIVIEEFAGADGLAALTPEWVIGALDRAHARIRQTQGGTTVAGAAVVEQDGLPYWLVFNVGDSRVYLRSGGEFSQVSIDHSVVQELVDAGRISVESARLHPQRHVITRAVGAADANRPDLWLVPALPGDRLLICSDGISAELSADVIEHEVAAGGAAQQVADALLDIALRAGGRDNISIVVVDVLGDAMLEGATIPSGNLDDERTLPRLPDRDVGPGRHAADEDSQEE